MVTATATEMGTEITMTTATITGTMMLSSQQLTKGGLPLHLPEMCSAVAGVMPCLPPWTQRSVHCPVLRHGDAIAKSVSSISRGRDPESSPWIVFFLQQLFSLLNNPLFPHTIQALKNPVSLLTLYLLDSYFIFLQKVSLGGDCIVCWQQAALWQG
jgi:hypothetical protein